MRKLKHFQIDVLQTKSRKVVNVISYNKNDALIDYINIHHNNEQGFIVTIKIKEIK